MYRLNLLVVVSFLLSPIFSFATSPARPVRHDVFSPNRAFVLDVNPQTETHVVYAVAERNNPLWSISCPVWLGPFFLSDDGQVVTTLCWKHVRVFDLEAGDCVQFWNKTGLFKAYSFEKLCPHPRRQGWMEMGPIGEFWRVWYDEADQAGDELRVSTTDLHQYTFSLTTGEIIDQRIDAGNLLRKSWPPLLMVVVAAGGSFYLIRRYRSRKQTGLDSQGWHQSDHVFKHPGF